MQDFHPQIKLSGRNYLLAIWPDYHTLLFPDAKLKNEPASAVVDTVYANSMQKVYLSGVPSVSGLRNGDNILIYRTAGGGNVPAKYASVASTVCVVDEVKNINEFDCIDDFFEYCGKNTVFQKSELVEFWEKRKYPYIIKMVYHFPLSKRINRESLLSILSNHAASRWSMISITNEQLNTILEASGDESFIIN